MGDYTKLIVDATVQVDRKELEAKLSELSLGDSSYHSGNRVKQIEEDTYYGDGPVLQLALIGQTKGGDRQGDFLSWLKPFVVQGSGAADCWAMQFSEHYREPKLWFMKGENDPQT